VGDNIKTEDQMRLGQCREKVKLTVQAYVSRVVTSLVRKLKRPWVT